MPLESKDFFTIGISSASLATTIILNLVNRAYTDKTARKIRSESYQLDEWKTARVEIQRALRPIEAAASDLRLLAMSGDDLGSLQAKLEADGRVLTKHVLLLEAELTRADPTWSQVAYGEMHGADSDWDLANEVLRAIGGAATANEVRVLIPQLLLHISSLCSCVTNTLRVRTADLDPHKI